MLERVDLPLAKLPTREDYEKRLQDKNVFIRATLAATWTCSTAARS